MFIVQINAIAIQTIFYVYRITSDLFQWICNVLRNDEHSSRRLSVSQCVTSRSWRFISSLCKTKTHQTNCNNPVMSSDTYLLRPAMLCYYGLSHQSPLNTSSAIWTYLLCHYIRLPQNHTNIRVCVCILYTQYTLRVYTFICIDCLEFYSRTALMGRKTLN